MRVAQARAQLADIDAQLAEMQVVAPSDSILEVLSVKVGDILPPNREAATLLLPRHFWVRVYVPESWLGLIKWASMFACGWIHFPAKISMARSSKSIARPNSRRAMSKPWQIGSSKYSASRFVCPDDDERLRAGMAADVYFPNVK